MLRLLERWGVQADGGATGKPQIVQASPGMPVGSMVASGEVDIGFQQLSELMHIEGIALLGTLPSPIESITVFSAAITSGCAKPDAARAFLAYMRSPDTAGVKRIHGMEPAG